MASIEVTGNTSIDRATTEVAQQIAMAHKGLDEAEVYAWATRLRDAIMAGTRDMDAPLPPLDDFKVSNGGALPGLVARALRLNGQAPGHYHDPAGKYDYCTTDHSFDGPVI